MPNATLKVHFEGGLGRVTDGSLPDGTYEAVVDYAETYAPPEDRLAGQTVPPPSDAPADGGPVTEPAPLVVPQVTEDEAQSIGMTALEANALGITSEQVTAIKAAQDASHAEASAGDKTDGSEHV